MRLSTKCVEGQCSCRELSFINDFSFHWAYLTPSYNLRFNCVYGVNYVSNDCSLGFNHMKFCTNYQFWGITSSSWHNDSGARTIFMFAQKKDREKFEMVWVQLLVSLYWWILAENMNRVKLNGKHAVVQSFYIRERLKKSVFLKKLFLFLLKINFFYMFWIILMC